MATVNPYFDVQQKALAGLRQIHRVCMGFEGLQVVAGLFALTIGFFDTKFGPMLHLYSLMLYFFLSVFAHVVVYYVFVAMGQNVDHAYKVNPRSVNEVLLVAMAKLKRKLLPVVGAHTFTVVMALVLWAATPQTQFVRKQLVLGVAVALGLVAANYVRLAVRRNANLITSFVTSGGFRGLEAGDA